MARDNRPKRTLREEWEAFLSKATAQDIKRLADAGINVEDPLDDNLPMFHRRFGTDGDSTGDANANSYFQKISAGVAKSKGRAEDANPSMELAVAIAARVIDAFDCTKSKEVRMHSDCMRLAIGYPSCGSQQEIAKRYGRSKSYISYRVRMIQRKFSLPLCAYNGNRTGK